MDIFKFTCLNLKLMNPTERYSVQKENNQVVLTINKKAVPKSVIAVLIALISIIYLIPISLIIRFGTDLGGGMIFGPLLAFALSYPLLRILFWNLYGREIICFKENGISYLADFKYFKTNPIEHEGKLELLGYYSVSAYGNKNSDFVLDDLLVEEVPEEAKLIFQLENKGIPTALELPMFLIDAILEELISHQVLPIDSFLHQYK